MSRDDRQPPPDRRFSLPGTGLPTTWWCMGCQKPRSAQGSRGVGVRRRCAQCIAQRAQKEAA